LKNSAMRKIVNEILPNVFYSQNNMLLMAKFFGVAISQRKAVALDRKGGK